MHVASSPSGRTLQLSVRHRRTRQGDAEGRAVAGAALGPDVPAVLRDDGAADGQAQPGAGFFAGVAPVNLDEIEVPAFLRYSR